MRLSLLQITIALASVTLMTLAEKARFDNYRVYSVEVENKEHWKMLQQLEIHQNDGISFLDSPSPSSQSVEIIVPPHKFADISELFDAYDMKNKIKIENLQKLIDEEKLNYSTEESYGWNQYYNLDDIYKWLDELILAYPKVLTNLSVGQSYEKRTIRAVKVSHKPGKPTIFIESTIHAREWITVATATYFLNELLKSTDPEIRELADKYDWVIVPVVNVDGYAYTHSTNRLWRKTRQPHKWLKFCVGADPNRNFDFHFRGGGTSIFPCSQIYPGPNAFSEPESYALSQFVQCFDNIKLYLAFHSYGQLLMFPYGHTKEHVKNYKDLLQIAEIAQEAISKRFQTKYRVGNIAETIYFASGSSADWVYATQNVSLSYAFEFRGERKSSNGFLLPPKQIIPNSVEIIDGIKAMIKEAQNLRYM